MSGGSSKKQETTSNQIDPMQLALFNQNYAKANAVADRPFQPYTGEMIAPVNPMLNQSFGMFGNIANNTIGASTLNSAMDAAKGISGYQPRNIMAETLPASDLSSYLNPFQKGVIDTTMGDLERQRSIAQMGDAQKAAAARAWGGSRSGVAQAETNSAYDRNAASTLAGLNFQNYNNAQGMATNDMNRRLSADTANQNADIASAGLRLNAGSQLSAMSDQELRQALSRAGAVGAVGDQQRSIQQQLDDAAYQEFLRQWQYPIEQQQLRNQALGMINPFLQQTTTTNSKTSSNPGTLGIISSLGGLALGAATGGLGFGLGPLLGSGLGGMATFANGTWTPGAGGFPENFSASGKW